MKAKATRPLLATAVAVGLILLGVLPSSSAGAAPRPRTHRTHPEVIESLVLRGTNGFTIDIKLKNRRRLALGASQIHSLFSLYGAGYELRAPQPRGSDDIDARIGRLGRIDVRFVPESVTKERPPRGCHGPKVVTEEGHYVGAIAFRGEGDYTSVRATSAPADIVRTPSLVCRSSSALSRRSRRGDRGIVEARRHKSAAEGELITVALRVKVRARPIRFKASLFTELKPSGKLAEPLTTFIAEAHRRRGRIKESSLAVAAFTAGKTFRLPEPSHPNRGAILSPPWPFEGTGTFHGDRKGASGWAGDLRVELPGFGEVHLAGPGSRATLCASPGCP